VRYSPSPYPHARMCRSRAVQNGPQNIVVEMLPSRPIDRVFLGRKTWRGRTLPLAALGRLPTSTDQPSQLVSRVSVERVSCAVVAPRRPWIGVPTRVLHVSQTGTSVE
jgi:hypothetical protein